MSECNLRYTQLSLTTVVHACSYIDDPGKKNKRTKKNDVVHVGYENFFTDLKTIATFGMINKKMQPVSDDV